MKSQRLLFAAALLVSTATTATTDPSVASAGASATTDIACGYVAAQTNIPIGAVGLSRGDGPIKAVLDAVGEGRTHSLIAHGNGYYTHSTMFAPGRPGWPDYCSTPLQPSELQNGYPGASQIDNAGLYMFYHQPEGNPVEYFYYQRSPTSNTGIDVANWLWTSSNYAWVSSVQNGSYGYWRVGFTGVTPYTQYSLYLYRDQEGINTGGVPYNYGTHCSGYLAYAQYMAGKGAVVAPSHTYSHSRVVSGINAIYASVENQCSNATGFWDDIGAAITCFEGICDDAARQVANCFTDGKSGRCYTDDDQYYKRVRDQVNPPGPKDQSGYSVAVSVSPDAIGGWNGHAYGSAAPNAVWSWDGNNNVQWNAAGNTYGCFF